MKSCNKHILNYTTIANKSLLIIYIRWYASSYKVVCFFLVCFVIHFFMCIIPYTSVIKYKQLDGLILKFDAFNLQEINKSGAVFLYFDYFYYLLLADNIGVSLEKATYRDYFCWWRRRPCQHPDFLVRSITLSL